MSFILDALRKSDQQRQRSATPTLMTAQVPAVEARQPALWWYGALAAVLIGAGILIGWMHQWQAEPATPAIQASAPKPPETVAQQFSPPPNVASPVSPRMQETQTPLRESGTTIAPVTPVPAIVAAKPEPAKPVMPGPVAATPVPATPPKPAEHVLAQEVAKDPGVMALAELPPLIQQELPKLSILAHSYSSKPKARFVFINDQMVHEEESPAPGLKLEQITPDGMIFSYKGYRFRRGANQ